MSQLQAIPSTRGERGVPVQLQIQVEGQNASGSHFSEVAVTVDISRNGARLAPLQASVPLNALLNAQYGGQKVSCRVVWLGKAPEERGQVGIRCLDENHVPWSHLLSADPVSASGVPQEGKAVDNNSAGETWPEQERRRAPRHTCNILANIRGVGDSFTTSARLTDISRNGGYLETMSPIPVGTEIKLTLETGEAKIPLIGIVRTLHPAMGNGVAFTKIDVGSLQLLESFLGNLEGPSQRHVEPSKAIGTHGSVAEQTGDPVPALDAQIEALVELLEQKSILNRQELLLHLQRKSSEI